MGQNILLLLYHKTLTVCNLYLQSLTFDALWSHTSEVLNDQ